MSSFLRRVKNRPAPLSAIQCDDVSSPRSECLDEQQVEHMFALAAKGAEHADGAMEDDTEQKESSEATEPGLEVSSSQPASPRKTKKSKADRLALQSLDFFNEAQRDAVDEMRQRCAEAMAQAGVHEGGEDDVLLWDTRMLRFLRGHKFDVQTACDMFTQMLTWRKDQCIDAIREEIVSARMRPADFPHHGRVVRFMPVHHDHGFDLEGRPVQVELLGRIDTKKLLSSFHEEEFLRHHIYSMEYMSLQLERLSRERQTIVRMVLIFDLAGFGMNHMRKSALDLLQKALKITQDYYPESMHCCFIINAPKVFSILWQVVKPLLAERTVKKVQVLGSSYTSELLKYIPAASIPASLGGARPDEWPLVFERTDTGGVDDDYDTLALSKGESRTLKIMVATDSYVAWGFFVHAGDLTFECVFQEHEAVQDNEEVCNHRGKVESTGGSFATSLPGTLLLTFDNSASWIKAKTVSYYVCVAPLAERRDLDSPRDGRLRKFFTSPIN